MKKINITNGEYFNNYFNETYKEECAPFNEAMIDGIAVTHLFSDKFIYIRSSEHGVSPDKYKNKLADFIQFLSNIDKYDEVVLWFGADLFCQINMLTVLATLEDRNYSGKVYSVIIDDETYQIIKNKELIILGEYKKLFEDIIINHKNVSSNNEILNQAIELYMDYLDENGKLANFIKDHNDLPEYELIYELLKINPDYGLGDLQAKKLIEKHRLSL